MDEVIELMWVLLFRALTACCPLRRLNESWLAGRVPDECPKEIAQLIDNCLATEPNDRPTAREVIRAILAAPSSPP